MIPIHPAAAPRMRCGGCGQDDCPYCREYARSPRYHKTRGAPDERHTTDIPPTYRRHTADAHHEQRQKTPRKIVNVDDFKEKTAPQKQPTPPDDHLVLLVGHNTDDAEGAFNRELAERVDIDRWFAPAKPGHKTQPAPALVEMFGCTMRTNWARKFDRAAKGAAAIILSGELPPQLVERAEASGAAIVRTASGDHAENVARQLTGILGAR